MDTIRYEKRDRLAVITLARPEAKNAVDLAMHDELCRIWRDIDADDALDVAILTGEGDAFCAGADLDSYVTANYVDATPSRCAKSSTSALAASPGASTTSAN